MAYIKNSDGIQQYYYKKAKTKQKIIQKDWFKDHKYTPRNTFPPNFFEDIEKILTPERRGYWAYAIDGDGCISLDKKRKKVGVTIPLNDREPIQQLADIYGSSISVIEYPEENWESTYKTALGGERGRHFLRLICPYMTEKRNKATYCINIFDPTYHPPKISMNFRKNPSLINPHMGMVAGFFDTEGSVGIKIRAQKRMTKKFGERIYSFLDPWLHFSNTDLRPLRKIKKILETWPFNFKSIIRVKRKGCLKKNGEECKTVYALHITQRQHLLFMKMFSPSILITRKREYADKFELKKKIYKLCSENK